jgi:hypothetical protein
MSAPMSEWDLIMDLDCAVSLRERALVACQTKPQGSPERLAVQAAYEAVGNAQQALYQALTAKQAQP